MSTIRYFTTDQAVRLTGLARGRLRYWHRHQFFAPEHLEGAGSYRWLYSFRDIVSLKVIARLLGRDVGLPELRRAAERMQNGKDDWIQLVFGVAAKKVFWKRTDDDHWEGAHPPGQLQFRVTVADVEAEISAEADNLKRRDQDDFGKISRHRFIAHNAWVISGTRIPVSTIKAFAAEGYDAEAIQKEYPQLSIADIVTAIGWERAATAF